MGALASQLWFIAFALTDAVRVRTLALIEVPLAQAVSLKMFREPPSLREGIGMSLIVVAAAILVWTGVGRPTRGSGPRRGEGCALLRAIEAFQRVKCPILQLEKSHEALI